MKANYSPSNKENYPLQNRSARKYTYTNSFRGSSDCSKNPYDYIAELEHELELERQRCKMIEQATIREQMNVLEQISLLEERFNKVTREKQSLQDELQRLSSDNFVEEYKKIKGISSALVGMMEKVEGRDGDVKQAWRWVKKVVLEHQMIRKKALKWKSAYEQRKNRTNTFEECSVSSDSSFDQ